MTMKGRLLKKNGLDAQRVSSGALHDARVASLAIQAPNRTP